MLLTAFGCKTDAAEQSAETSMVATADSAAEAIPPVEVDEGHDFTFLTHQLWHYKGAVGPESLGPEPYKSEWIDLEPDGTFTAGKQQTQTHTGTWRYNDSLKILGLQPNDRDFSPSEWNVMYNQEMMVWVGTKAFGNQSTQIRLVRSETRPE